MSDPLWVVPGERTFPRLQGQTEADVAVVGGGFSGLGAAWAAMQSGASVVVLEARTIAAGASGRNAGFILSGPAMGFGASVAAIGLEETLEIWRLTEENHSLLLSLLEELSTDCGYLRRGSLSLAASDTEWDVMQEECGRMLNAGLNVCLMPSSSLPRPFDSLYQGGVYHPGNAELDPGAFLRGMARHLATRVTIFEESPVEVIENGEQLLLLSLEGTVTARRVVVATNAYTDTLLRAVPIAPTRGQVASTRPLSRVIAPFPMYADRGFQYWRQTADGRLVVGGWRNLDLEAEVGRDELLHERIQAALRHFVEQVAPGAGIERRWAGIMGFTPDHYPLVGPVPGHAGIFMAAGYSGHGVAMAFICGARAARESLGEGAIIPGAFRPERLIPV